MTKSKIEWTDYTINPVKGLCPVACKDNQGKEYCYARRMYHRFNWNPEIRFDVQPLLDVEKIKKPSRIFVGSTIELFGEWIDAFWLDSIFRTVKDNPQHTFIFLTKRPQNLIKFLGGNITNAHKGYIKPEPLPDNVWMGVTVTDRQSAYGAKDFLSEVRAKVKFLSLEPLLGKMDGDVLGNIIPLADWVIIGVQTPKSFLSLKLDWVLDIVLAADKANVPVFLKNNLRLNPLGYYEVNWAFRNRTLRQEMPKE